MFLKTPFLLFIISLPLFFCDIYAQNIRGEVLDFETNEKLPFVNVYFNSSQRGTTTDQNGFFELNTSDFFGQDIVVSSVGYDTWIIEDFEQNKYYKVFLKPSSQLLRELIIVHNDMPRKKKERIFKTEFLGTTSFAAQCTIENIKEIILTYFKESKTLEAYCDKPIIINNKALGYKIKYYLNNFKLNESNLAYSGNFLFEEDTLQTTQEKRRLIKNRKAAYFGSRMHFFRELWNGQNANPNYYLSSASTDAYLCIDSLITDEVENIKFLLPNHGNIKIHFFERISLIEFQGSKQVPFTKIGFFDSKNLYWKGIMADQRVGDLLPFEYWPYD